MHKVYQTETEPGTGNCMSACIASLLGFKIEEVPNFRTNTKSGLEFLEAIQIFLAEFELYMLVVRLDTEEISHYPIPDGALCIAGGDSPNHSNIKHAIVGRMKNNNFELLHDPNPNSNGFKNYSDIRTLHFIVDFNVSERLNGI